MSVQQTHHQHVTPALTSPVLILTTFKFHSKMCLQHCSGVTQHLLYPPGQESRNTKKEQLIPGTFQTSQMPESTKKAIERIAEAINNPLSSLTSQLPKHDI